MFTWVCIYSIIPVGGTHDFETETGILSATPLYLKHFGLKRIPFRLQPDPEIFFAEGGRGDILLALCEDIVAGKGLVKLTGEEGTGKTLFFLLLARKLEIKKCEVIPLEHPVGSFEDLLRTVWRILRGGADGVGEKSEKGGQEGFLPELLGLLRGKKMAGQRVVLLIDEAEKLFLATLERLVRLLAEISQDSPMQVVLIGRPELDKNLQQLSSFCAQADVHAGYELQSLSGQETKRYLRFRLARAGMPEEKAREIFTDEAVSVLHDSARGNIRQAHLLADQGMVLAYESGMFRVDAGLVAPRQVTARKRSAGLASIAGRLENYRFQVLAALVLAALVLLLTLWPEKRNRALPEPPAEIFTTTSETPLAGLEAEKVGLAEVEEEQNESGKDSSAISVPAGQPAGASARQSPGAGKDETGNSPATEPTLEKVAPFSAEEDSSAAKPDVMPEPATAPLSLAFPEPPEKVQKPVVHVQEPEIREMSDDLTVERISSAEKKTVILQADSRKRKVVQAATFKKPAAGETIDPERLFAERLRASSGWLDRAGYTIQLMALASDGAEESFKLLLAQERYRAVKDQLYVVRKTDPPTLFVYYGYFETMEQARRGRDRLPEFLLKNHPYPLAIDRAAKKVRE